MGKRDAMYMLTNQVELDVSYFPTFILIEDNGEKVLETKKTIVLVISDIQAVDEILTEYLSNIPDNDSINKASGQIKRASKQSVKKVIHYIKVFAVPNQRYETIKPFIKKNIDTEAKALTDGSKSLFRLKELLKEHEGHHETDGGKHEVGQK